MDDNHYQTDKLAIFEQHQEIAAQSLGDIEAKCEATPLAFLKANFDNVKVRDRRTEPVFKVTVAVMLAKICALAGIKAEVDNFNAEDINKMILSTYSDLTLEEIYKAFEMERYGVYEAKNEHYGLFNADYVSAVLKKYRKWKQDVKFQHNIGPAQLPPQISETEKQQILLSGIVRVFNEYSETKVLPDPNAYIFDALYEKSLIRDAETPGEHEYYQKQYAKAKKLVEAEIKNAKNDISSSATISTYHKRAYKEEISKILEGKSDKVIIRCKSLILQDYFDKLIKQGVTIETVLS